MTDTLKKVFLTIAALAALALGGAAIAGATSGGTDNAAQEQSEPAESEASEAADTGQKGDHEGDHQDKGDKVLSGDTAARAREAALAKTGGGKAGTVEAESDERSGDEREARGSGATYGVEVTKPDGSKVDVFLDDQFNAIAVDSDE